MSKQVLFVDDEEYILDGLKRALRPRRHEWTTHFAQSGAQGIALLQQHTFDVVVSDMRMPGMDGAEFLEQVCKIQPRTVRLILSGQCDRTSILRALGHTHQFLNKPCDAETITRVLQHTFVLQQLINPALWSLLTPVNNLPSLPLLHQKIVEQLSGPEVSVSVLKDIVGRDPAMTARILQLVNSALFESARQITQASSAVDVLGAESLSYLVTQVGVFAPAVPSEIPLDLDAENNHAFRVKMAARTIAECEQLDGDKKAKALTAALIHDLGKLLLAWQMPQEYTKVRHLIKAGMSCIQAEQKVFHGDHAQLGSWLFGLWGLPESLIKAVALHHDPTILNSPELDTAVVVNVANLMAHQFDSSENTAALVPPSQLISTPWESKYPFWAQAFLKSKQEWAASPELSRATAV
ncbi:MAG TPA: response regulator [Terriglobales bacterium]|nr:response regulator [Terriglobales bacterium]